MHPMNEVGFLGLISRRRAQVSDPHASAAVGFLTQTGGMRSEIWQLS